MRLARLLRGAPAEPQQRRRRRSPPRPDAPRTIVALPEGDEQRFDLRVDAARDRLRRQIPPVDDDA